MEANNSVTVPLDLVREAIEHICSTLPMAQAPKRQQVLRALLQKYETGARSSELELLRIYPPPSGATGRKRNIVRTQIFELNEGLEKYYQHAGRQSPVKISVRRY